mmetsp:Transcript_124262/g.220203  ORF Transcript_124262/g.220203 Transcript_124262/m.220203 type:complete len:205 (+) Transcript_124262:316-930(+)
MLPAQRWPLARCRWEIQARVRTQLVAHSSGSSSDRRLPSLLGRHRLLRKSGQVRLLMERAAVLQQSMLLRRPTQSMLLTLSTLPMLSERTRWLTQRLRTHQLHHWSRQRSFSRPRQVASWTVCQVPIAAEMLSRSPLSLLFQVMYTRLLCHYQRRCTKCCRQLQQISQRLGMSSTSQLARWILMLPLAHRQSAVAYAMAPIAPM